MENESSLRTTPKLNHTNETIKYCETNIKDFYNEKNLSKYLLSSVYKKSWEQRLQWFESKIITFYKNMNKSNILIVGRKSFLDTFKRSCQKCGWNNSNLTFVISPDESVLSSGYDLIIDAKYFPEYFSSIYRGLNAQSFIYAYSEILIEETISFLKKNEIFFFYFEIPILRKIKNLNEVDKKFIINDPKERYDFFNNEAKLNELLELLYKDNEDSQSYMRQKLKYELYQINNGKYRVFADCSHGDLLNVVNGIRTTCYHNNNENSKKINIYGPCTVAGTFTCDSCTIESYLQLKLNAEKKNYNVFNYGVSKEDVINDFERIIDTEFRTGDIVIIISEPTQFAIKVFEKLNVNIYPTSSIFERPHNYGNWMLFSDGQINHNGNMALADYIFKTIKPKLDNKSEGLEMFKFHLEEEVDNFLLDNPDFNSYINELKKMKEEKNIKGKIGYCIMNCNPFTLGHRYLIEKALEIVNYLYIFILSEDVSTFPFKDRINLVKKGVEDLKNRICVLPMCKWIATIISFPEYYTRKEFSYFDITQDIHLAAKYICPSLGITKQFVGSEPNDSLTRRYNVNIKNVLPKYGIKCYIIERKKIKEGNDEKAISAKNIRNIIKLSSGKSPSQEDIENLKKLVPCTTLEYLISNWNSIKTKLL